MSNDSQSLGEIAGEAAEAIRALNHRTLMHHSVTQPSTIYEVLGELYTMTGGLRQLVDQLNRALGEQLDTGHMRLDPGSPYGDSPEAVPVMEAQHNLTAASDALQALYGHLTAAQMDISALSVATDD